MKLLQSMLFSLLLGMAVAAHAVDQDVQVDLLMAKITSALKANRAADALPSFAELEGMEPSLKNPLPESFYFYYIDTLDKTGDKTKALSRAEAYLNKYGKKGKHYGEVIEIMAKLQMQVDRDVKAAAERRENARLEKESHCKKMYMLFDKVNSCAGDDSCSRRKYDALRDEWKEEKRLCYD